MIKKWKQIVDKHNENVDYVNADDTWEYSDPIVYIFMLAMLILPAILIKFC